MHTDSVHSPWLPGYIDVAQTILIISTMAGLLPDRLHTLVVKDLVLSSKAILFYYSYYSSYIFSWFFLKHLFFQVNLIKILTNGKKNYQGYNQTALNSHFNF